jgi:hypothetical protein
MLPGGLPATDLVSAAAALAATELRLPQAWCTAATAHLAAAAAVLPPLALLQAVFAAANWRVKLPKQLLHAVQELEQQQLQPEQLLPPPQLSKVASALLAAGQAVPKVLVPHLPESAAAAAAAADSRAASQSPARLAEALWQQARSVLSFTEQSSSMDADVVAAAVTGLAGMQAAELLSCMKQPERWSIVLQAFAYQHQQQQGAGDVVTSESLLLQQPGVREFVAQVAAAVQQAPGTALVAASGPSTLLALAAVGLDVQQPWLAALVSDMNAQAGSKTSWYKHASGAETLAYLQALAAAGQVVPLQQLAALAKHLPSKLSTLPVAQLVLLLQLLPAAELPAAAGSPAAGKHHPQLKQQHQAVDVITAATMALLLQAAEAGKLLAVQAQHVIVALVRLGSKALEVTVAPDDSSSSSSSSNERSSNKKAQAQQSQKSWATVEGVQLLLRVAHGSPDESQQQADVAVGGEVGIACLLGSMQLAQTLPPASRSTPLLQQLLQLFVAELSQQDAQLHPHIAAQLFCPAVAMTVTLNPGVALGSERPEPLLGGCLVQCLADIEAAWEAVGPGELAALPRMAAMVQLEIAQPQEFINTVLLRLQELAKLAKVSQAAAAEAVAAGAGPGLLLNAAVLLVMNRKPAEAGNSTWQGLHRYVTQADGSADAGAEQQQLLLPVAAFDAANEAASVLSSSMSGGELCDLLHCFFMARQMQRGQRQMPWMQPASQKIGEAAATLSHNQQQALLVMMREIAGIPQQQSPETLQVGCIAAAWGWL